ncbi:MAG: hypothetical protein O2971_20015 [Proteobacteria bacterium]|nr:hypothetical protein [Pseudomonadota bacterium]
MNWEAIGVFAELLAAIGVLITLIYLSVQVRQANAQALLASQRHRADAAREVLLSVSDSDHLAPILAELGGFPWGDTESSVRVFMWCHAWMRTEEMNFRMNSPEQRATQDQLLKGWLSVPWAANFWVENRAIYDTDFAKRLDALLENEQRNRVQTEGLFAQRKDT